MTPPANRTCVVLRNAQNAQLVRNVARPRARAFNFENLRVSVQGINKKSGLDRLDWTDQVQLKLISQPILVM